MKIKIPDKCKDCQFCVHDNYYYWKCTIYKKLQKAITKEILNKKPDWCLAEEVEIKEK